MTRRCSMSGCVRRHHARDLCGAHYKSAREELRIDVRPPVGPFWAAVDQSGGTDTCWVWTRGRHTFGHGHFYCAGKNLKAHRVAWQLTNGPIPDGLFVLHHCDNPPCCNPAHLFLGTQLDNMRDRNRKGRANIKRGLAHPGAKLSAFDVEAIFILADQGWRFADIARVIAVSIGTICAVVGGKRYAEVPA